MKYKDKYPQAVILKDYHGVIRGNEFDPCWGCREPTQWYDDSPYVKAPSCSEECSLKIGFLQ